MMITFEWDKLKRIRNLEKHGLDFMDVYALWDQPTLIAEDQRYDYGENRFIGLGLLKNRVVVCAFTKRENEVIRIISFRKANSREAKRYEDIIKKT